MRFFLLVLPILLSSCASGQAYQQRQEACAFYAQQLDRNSDWANQCVLDDSVFQKAYAENLMQASPEVVCYNNLFGDSSPSERLSIEIADARGISCKKYHKEISQTVVKEATVNGLCKSWSSNTGGKIFREEVRKEVKKRELNCPQVILSLIHI